MHMKIIEVIGSIEQSEGFCEWKKQHGNAAVMSLFTIFESEARDEWLASYYDAESGKITTFGFDNGLCFLKGEEPAASPPNLLDTAKIRVELEEAVRTARDMLERKTGERTAKVIAVVQNIEQGQVWNVSQLTGSFRMHNAKIDAETGKLVSEDYGEIFSRV